MAPITDLVDVLTHLGMRAGLPVEDVQRNLVRTDRGESLAVRIKAFYLLEMDERRLYQESGHASTAHFAETILDLPKRRTTELLHIARKLQELRQLDRAFCNKRLSWSKLRLLARVVVPEHETRWLEHAQRVTVRKLILGSSDDGTLAGRTPINDSLYRLTLRKEGKDTLLCTREGDIPIDGAGHRCDAHILTIHDDEGPRNPHCITKDVKTPPWLREKVLCRDQHRCRHCAGTIGLEVHHIRFREDGGPTIAKNLLVLCRRCHSLVHGGCLAIQGGHERRARFVDRQGHDVVDPAPYTDATEGLTEAAPAATPMPLVTLDAIPQEIDASWWVRHAHLIHPRRNGLVFKTGAAAEAQAGARAPAAEPDYLGSSLCALRGRARVVDLLHTTARASRKRGRSFPHTLFVGPAGTGKTTLARATFELLGGRLHEATGPLLQDPHALVGLLAALEAGDVVFLDEIHAMPVSLMETLYQALAEGMVTLSLREGTCSRTVRLKLPAFTLLAATTERTKLPAALISRFDPVVELGHLDEGAMTALVQGALAKEGARAPAAEACFLGRHARGVPRTALRLVDRVLDEVALQDTDTITMDIVATVLARLGYENGLTPDEQRYLTLLRKSGKPTSIRRLAALMGLTEDIVARVIEPELFARHLVFASERGRELIVQRKWADSVKESGPVVRPSRREYAALQGVGAA